MQPSKCVKPDILLRNVCTKDLSKVNRACIIHLIKNYFFNIYPIKIIYVKYLHTHLSPPLAGSWREKINLSKDTF